jgi:hypothetical protein
LMEDEAPDIDFGQIIERGWAVIRADVRASLLGT